MTWIQDGWTSLAWETFSFLSGTNIYHCPLCLRDFAVDKANVKEQVLTYNFPAKAREENKFAAGSSDVSVSIKINSLSDSSAVTDKSSDVYQNPVWFFNAWKSGRNLPGMV